MNILHTLYIVCDISRILKRIRTLYISYISTLPKPVPSSLTFGIMKTGKGRGSGAGEKEKKVKKRKKKKEKEEKMNKTQEKRAQKEKNRKETSDEDGVPGGKGGGGWF